MSGRLRVLLVEDSPTDAKLVLQALRAGGHEVASERVEDESAMRAALDTQKWDAIVSDWSLPRFSGLAALALMREKGLDLPFIIVSGTIGEEIAVEAMRAGADDYVLKDNLTRLAPAIERELRERKVHEALRKSEEQLRQAQKMEAVGRLAGGVAHDFNNLLSVILSYSEMILEDLRPGAPLRAEVEEMQLAGRRAAALTRQLLMFSRQEVVEARVLDLNEVLANLENMLRRILGEDIELVSLLAPGLGRIRADPGHVEQVIMNLCVNSRDAMPTGGKLTLETGNVVLDEATARDHLGLTPGRYVLLAVSDTGVGMDRATQARIFEPFFTTKVKGKGTGLGLSTVFGLVHQAAGSIWVYSEPGHGTVFKVYLPRVDADLEAPSRPVASARLEGSETVLLVEDEDQVRSVARGILRKLGYQVLEASNANEALLAAETYQGPIHLLLTDVVMPQMSGPELAKRLLRARPATKILCMSGYTDDALLRHGALGGGIAYLQKPITPEALGRKVRAVLDAK